jgi:hypothetical protein
MLFLACACLLLLLTAAAAPAKRVTEDCTWGASSVIVVNGVQSEPVTTGCIPR